MLGALQNCSVSPVVVRRQVDKILESAELSGAVILCNLLVFLTNHSIESPGESAKEYDVAVGVLGKPEGFDSRLDSTVRVHAARLRAKLAEYYMSTGSEDPVLIEIPKGSYQILWRLRAAQTVPPQVEPPVQPVVQGKLGHFSRRWYVAGFATAVVAACAALGVWVSARAGSLPIAVDMFWQPFLRSPRPPIIVFSNHRFAGTLATGLHPFRKDIDSPETLVDTFSGTGTVMAVAELSSLLSVAGRSPRLKRAELFTWDEAEDANVVFVGSPEANSPLRELPPLQDFTFKASLAEPRFGTGGIVNLHPGPGEESIYFGSDRPFVFDYAVIALVPSLHPDHKVLILAGTNTYGCQAAAEFLTRSDMLRELSTRLGVPRGGKFPDFEILLKVNIIGGAVVQPKVLLVRVHESSRPAH